MTTIWELKRGETLLGFGTITGGDFPWHYGDFVAAPAFAEVKPLFDRAAELLDSDDESWEEAYDAVDDLGVRLVDQRTGRDVVLDGLCIRGEMASFRKRRPSDARHAECAVLPCGSFPMREGMRSITQRKVPLAHPHLTNEVQHAVLTMTGLSGHARCACDAAGRNSNGWPAPHGPKSPSRRVGYNFRQLSPRARYSIRFDYRLALLMDLTPYPLPYEGRDTMATGFL